MILRFLLASLALLIASACAPYQFRRAEKPKPGKHLLATAKETGELSDREYLMRKATLGSRAERLEALDVIERANDPELFTFLMERLKKEDDRFLQIKIMHALAAYGDVRAVPALRYYARWDQTRVGVEAIAALYELGDDSFVPNLILKLRPNEDAPEMAGIAHRALKKMTGADLPPSVRAWMNYYRIHRLAPYESRAWYWPFRQPLPPTQEGTTIVATRPKGKPPLPDKDIKVRRTHVTWTDFWKPDEP
ncbi:MAG TPA: hypothetical protein VEJ63_04620 [Planctomycetota bacterium]|nr:hypothetical protein [Planctomycetota bacterium]